MSESVENKMEMSGLSSDWDIVQSTSTIKLDDELKDENNLQKQEVGENTSNGNRIQDIKYADLSESLQGLPTVEDADKCLQDIDCLSNASSDVDIIDEMVDDTLGSLAIPSLDISFDTIGRQLNTIIGEATETEPRIQPPFNNQPSWLERYRRLIRNRQIRESAYVAVISLLLICCFYFIAPAQEPYQKMKEQMSALQTENTELKSKVLSKIEDDKLFVTLEEQVKALKSENSKLSGSMQMLIQQLEEQTTIFKKENEMREKDPYKEVIDKLKEQVNILQIDNEELQKQLFRMRYGIYSPNPEDPNVANTPDGKGESKNHMVDEGKNVNRSQILTKDEKLELKKEIFAELAKLKNWEESVQNIMKMLGTQEDESEDKEKLKSEGKEYTDGVKTSAGQEESVKYKRTNKRENDWTWKDLKKNLKGTLDSTLDSLPTINVSDLLSKYGIVDKKKMEGVFESVGHYFKKAQEKTKKILSYDNDGKNDFWDFLGDLRKKWHNVKEEFIGKNFPDAGNDHKPESAAKYPENYHESDTSYKKHKKHKGQGSEPTINGKHSSHVPPIEKPESFETLDMSEENAREKDNQEEGNLDSWMFERAAQRSEIRDTEEDMSTNWFLRKRKDVEMDDVLAKFSEKFFSNFPPEHKVEQTEEENNE